MADDDRTLPALPLPDAGHRPVFLIGAGERLTFQVGDTTFFYRRLPPSTSVQLQRQHSERGLLDQSRSLALLVDIARYCLRGWDNLRDAEGKSVPYLEELVEHLPHAVLQTLNALVMEESPDELMGRYQDFLASAIPSSGRAGSP